MTVVLSQRASHDLDSQIQYLIDQQAARAARRLHARVITFLRQTLATHPHIGIEVEHRDLRELWIPGTKFVIWYRVNDQTIEIARLWHTSQDRQSVP